MYRTATIDSDQLPSDMVNDNVTQEFLVEAYIIRPKKITVKKIYDRSLIIAYKPTYR